MENSKTRQTYELAVISIGVFLCRSISVCTHILYIDPPYNRPLAYPFTDITSGISTLLLALLLVRIILSVKEQGLKHIISTVLGGGVIGIISSPLCYLVLKGIKHITSENTLHIIADALELISIPFVFVNENAVIVMLILIAIILGLKYIISKKYC